jgi:hypothetical protein
LAGLSKFVTRVSFQEPARRGKIISFQTVERVSYCAPVSHVDRGFCYICRDTPAQRWMCHAFVAKKDKVASSKGLTRPLQIFIIFERPLKAASNFYNFKGLTRPLQIFIIFEGLSRPLQIFITLKVLQGHFNFLSFLKAG